MNQLLIEAGRILIGLLFAIGAVIDYRGRQALMGMLADKKIKYREYLLPAAISLKLIAGLAIMFNMLTALAGIALILFTLIANIIFNDFWSLKGQQREIRLVHFLAYMAVIGGLLLLVGFYL